MVPLATMAIRRRVDVDDDLPLRLCAAGATR